MRNILNISVSKDLSRAVDKLVAKGKYSTKSEFLRELIRARIMEEDLSVRIGKSREEINRGNGKVLKSLRDLR
jgi:Arc/MetJ-type ribon-helix-helix transcriptional regulator